MLWIAKVLVPTILALVLSIATVPVETASPLLTVAQTNPPKIYGTVYFDPPTINGTAIGVNNNVTVNLNISKADEINAWQAGLYFNATALECLEFNEGEFLKRGGSTIPYPGTIDNTAGVITPYSYFLQGLGNNVTGDGQLAYLRFKVKALGVSDLHLRSVMVFVSGFEVPSSMIDVYTVVVNATSHTVVTVSNSTSQKSPYISHFYDHSFNQTLQELSFKVSSPYPGFSNVTIPKLLLNVSTLEEWRVIIVGIPINRTITENTTHTSIYFTYTVGIHEIHITTRPLISSTVSIALSEYSITSGSNVTISGAIDPVRPNVTVSITYRENATIPGVFSPWTTLDIVTTDSNSNYSYTWTPGAAGTYEFKASWGGDLITEGAESDVLSLTVLKMPSTISIALSSTTITLGSNVTITGEITAEDPINPLRPGKEVTIQFRPSGTAWTELDKVNTDQNSEYSYTLKVEKLGLKINKAGTYEFKASWGGDLITEGAESDVLSLTVLKMPSTISIALSSTTITLGSNVTITGTIDPWRAVETVTIQYKPNGGDLTTLANLTAVNSKYNYTWTPDEAGTYEFKASWDGDEGTEGAESEVLVLTVKEAPSGIPIEIVIVATVVIIVIAAVVVYFVKFRKS